MFCYRCWLIEHGSNSCSCQPSVSLAYLPIPSCLNLLNPQGKVVGHSCSSTEVDILAIADHGLEKIFPDSLELEYGP